MNQTTIFDFLYDTFKINKPIRLIEFFAGIGSQAKALKNLNASFEHWHICEWAIPSILAYNEIHHNELPKYGIDYSKDLTKEEIVEYLFKRGVSINYNEPAKLEQIKRMQEDKLRNLYNAIISTNNLVNVQETHGKDLEIIEKDKYCYMLSYSFPCVTKNTLVLSEKGYIPFRDLNIGDKVLTKSNTWQKVVKQFDNGVQDVYMLNAYGTAGIECTKEHKFYAREMYRKGHNNTRCFKEPKMVHAKDLTTKHYLGIPVIKEEIPFYSSDLDFWYMIGYYLGDGWLSSKSNDIILACNDKKLEKLKEKLDINKWKYTYNLDGTCYKLRFSSIKVYEFIKNNIGTGSESKHIPIEILNLPKEQLMSLYQGYLDSDGCIINNKHQFSTINENIAYSLTSIIHKLFNRPASVYKIKVNPQKEIQGRIVNQKEWYQIRFKLTKDKQDKAFYEDNYIWFPFKNLTYLRKDNVYNMEIENDHSYIINGLVSANCQDLSLAGLGKGMSRDAGTRSGMLWEVERILDECSELGTLPDVLLMENVPQVIGANAINDFQEWRAKLETLGYSNYVEILNSKDYGIPQSRERCFMVSILGEYNYTFPSKIPLELKLKDMLEKHVDEKYYLSDKQINQIMYWNAQQEPYETLGKEISPTLTTRSCAYAGGMILTSDLEDAKEEKEVGKQLMNMKRTLCNQLIKEGKVKENDVIRHNYTNSKNGDCIQSNNECPTLDTRCDCLGVVVNDEEESEGMWTETQLKMLTPDGNVKRYIDSDIVDEFKEGQAADISFPNGYGHGKRTFDECPTLNTTSAKSNFIVKVEEDSYVEKKYKQFIDENGYVPEVFQPYNSYEVTDVAPTVLASCGNPGGISSITIKSNLRIRKLTPKETYRLMGFSDEDYENASKVCSDALIWHQAGDSIVVRVLEQIFKQMLADC